MLAVRVGWVLAALISAFATLWGCRDGLLMGPLSDDEVAAVATQLAARGELNIDAADIGVAITRITDELPSPADLDRVQRRLDGIGWPVDPEFSCHAVMLAVRRVCCRRPSPARWTWCGGNSRFISDRHRTQIWPPFRLRPAGSRLCCVPKIMCLEHS